MSPALRSASRKTGRIALLAGASGLVGKEVLRLLLESEHYRQVHVLVRRPLSQTHAKLIAHVVDFEVLGKTPLSAINDVYCCLGTTIKAAGSQTAFRRVDHDYVLATARLGLAAGAQTLALVSAMGASAKSAVFYNRVKGEAEHAVAALGFRHVIIVRPSLLAGERSEYRVAERLALTVLSPVAWAIPARYRPIPAVKVAKAMVNAVVQAAPGVQIIESDLLQRV